MNTEIRNLDRLAIFHYIVGGMMALFSCIVSMNVIIGYFMMPLPDVSLNWIVPVVDLIFLMLMWFITVCIILVGKKLNMRNNLTFCRVIAGVECIFIPFGTILGICSLIMLKKEVIKEVFAQATVGNQL